MKEDLRNKIEKILLEYDPGGYYDPYVEKLLNLFEENKKRFALDIKNFHCLGCSGESEYCKGASISTLCPAGIHPNNMNCECSG